MWWNQDWEQLRKNLKLERAEWEKYEEKQQILRDSMLRKLEKLEREKERIKAEYKRKVAWSHRAYLRNVEKKFKPSISIK